MKDADKLSSEELKQRMNDLEEKYHESFKGNRCSEIMSAYYSWQEARKLYYKSTGRIAPSIERDCDDD